MPLVLNRPQWVADWVGEQCGCAAPHVDAAIGYVSDGELTAGVYFDSMLPNTVFAHIANAGLTLPRSLLAATCWYAFVKCGVDRITFLVSAANQAVVRLVTALGAELEGRLHRAYGSADALFYAFWRDCEWARRLLAVNRSAA